MNRQRPAEQPRVTVLTLMRISLTILWRIRLGIAGGTLLILVLNGCASRPATGPTSGSEMARHMPEVMKSLGAERLNREYSSNGERIYYTATSASGKPIVARIGLVTMTGPMMSCVDCHGPAGEGGPIQYCIECHGEESPMATFHAPPLRYYGDELMKRAITEGIGPDGRHLFTPMPRWSMSDEDLEDLLLYLRTILRHEE